MSGCRQQTLKGNNSGSCKVSKKLGAIQLMQIDKLPKEKEPDSSDVNLEELWG